MDIPRDCPRRVVLRVRLLAKANSKSKWLGSDASLQRSWAWSFNLIKRAVPRWVRCIDSCCNHSNFVRSGSVCAAQRLVGAPSQRAVPDVLFYDLGRIERGRAAILFHRCSTAWYADALSPHARRQQNRRVHCRHAFTVCITWHDLYSNGIYEQAVILFCAFRAIDDRVDLWTDPTFAQFGDH